MSEDAPLLVFSDDWGRHPSSCQHLVRHLLPRRRVTWVNTIGMRPPRLDLATAKRNEAAAESCAGAAPCFSGAFGLAAGGAAPAGPSVATAVAGKANAHKAQDRGRERPKFRASRMFGRVAAPPAACQAEDLPL